MRARERRWEEEMEEATAFIMAGGFVAGLLSNASLSTYLEDKRGFVSTHAHVSGVLFVFSCSPTCPCARPLCVAQRFCQ
eukprot:1433026-Rhodomonas_salina.1